MNKYLLTALIIVVLSSIYKVNLLQSRVEDLTKKLKDQAIQQETYKNCLDDANNSYQIFLDSYVENAGTPLYPNYKIDKDTREWLDQRIANDRRFCKDEFGPK